MICYTLLNRTVLRRFFMPSETKKRNYNGGIFNIPPCLIKPNPSLARTDFPDTSLVSLADSIRRYGILQPLAVRLSENGRYELIAGERRLRAAILLSLETVPCIIIESCREYEYLSVVENTQREKLNIFDEARAIRRLYEGNGRDISKVAKLLSVGEREIERKLRLCGFTRAEMQAILRLGFSEEAEVFLCVAPPLRYYTIKLCAEKGYSVGDTARLCRALSESKVISPDDLESFAGRFFGAAEKAAYARKTNQKVILRDLGTFEASLRKICGILEKAGCKTSVNSKTDGTQTVYTVTVRSM